MTALLLALSMIAALAVCCFCAGIETGFLSLSRGRVVHLARAGSARAKIVQKAISDMPRTITGILAGNNLAAVAFSSASAALAARAFPDSASARAAWGVCAATAVLYLGEFLPKLFCSTRPLRRTLMLAPFWRVFSAVVYPFAAAAAAFGGGKRQRDNVTADDMLQILRDRKDGVRLTDFESALIARILVLRKKNEPVTPDSLLAALDETDEQEED